VEEAVAAVVAAVEEEESRQEEPETLEIVGTNRPCTRLLLFWLVVIVFNNPRLSLFQNSFLRWS
jgi:hypothetical protein